MPRGRNILDVARLAPCTLLLVAACRATDSAAPIQQPVELTVLAQSNFQRGAIGAPLAKPLEVLVTRRGSPVVGASVSWSTSAGTVVPTRAITDTAGVASAIWTLAREDTAHVVHARAALVEQPTNTVTFAATIAGDVALEVVSSADELTGEVGIPLAHTLRVRATNHGVAVPGVTVVWRSVGEPVRSSVSDTDGIATLGWTLPVLAGRQMITASIASDTGMSVALTANALAGAVASLKLVSGDKQSVPLNVAPSAIQSLVVRAVDRYDNDAPNAPVDWSIESGSGVLSSIDHATNRFGTSSARIASGGREGRTTVRATSNGQSVRFVYEARAAEYRVTLYTGTTQFVSAQNNSMPATDEVPVGSTMIWTLDPFDYDQHTVTFYSGPTTPGGGEFPYASPSQVRVTFTVPGTYRYRDIYYGGEGVVIVTPPAAVRPTGRP